jgi:hypothetical protein
MYIIDHIRYVVYMIYVYTQSHDCTSTAHARAHVHCLAYALAILTTISISPQFCRQLQVLAGVGMKVSSKKSKRNQ